MSLMLFPALVATRCPLQHVVVSSVDEDRLRCTIVILDAEQMRAHVLRARVDGEAYWEQNGVAVTLKATGSMRLCCKPPLLASFCNAPDVGEIPVYGTLRVSARHALLDILVHT